MAESDFSLPPGVHTVAMGVGDMNGILRGKRIPSSHWESVCVRGNALSLALFALDMTCDVWDTPYVNFGNGYPDMHLFPNSKPVATPWEPGVAFCMARAEGLDHKPVPIDPRNALVKQVERAASKGYKVQIGAELEFYLLDPETKKPRDRGIQVYSLLRAAELEHVVGPIRRQLNEIGIPIEQSNPEYAPGQVEVNIRYDDALVSADRVVMFRSLTKELAHINGYMATFMSKPFSGQSGNGFHTHHSLWKDGVNQFADQGRLSRMGRNYLAGMQVRMAETTLVAATTPNAYRRRRPYSFCPINVSWGIDNRTVGLRVIEGHDSGVRVEKRDGSADCNPYYLMACEIAAGLDGIEHAMEPSPITEGDAYSEEGLSPLPGDIQAAIEWARQSRFMEEVCGQDGFRILLQQAEREQSFIADEVTQTEMQRYMGNF